jgi:hypothetical protein
MFHLKILCEFHVTLVLFSSEHKKKITLQIGKKFLFIKFHLFKCSIRLLKCKQICIYCLKKKQFLKLSKKKEKKSSKLNKKLDDFYGIRLVIKKV